MKRLYESLLDNDDELFDRTGNVVVNDEINDPNSEFRKLFRLDYLSSYMQGRPIEGTPLNYDNKTLYVDDDVIRDNLYVKIESRLYDKTLNDFCDGIKSLECKICGLKICTDGKVLDDKLICKNISAPNISLMSKNINNVNLNIINSDAKGTNMIRSRRPGRDIRPFLMFETPFDYINISNTTMTNNIAVGIALQFTNIPVFKNVKAKGFKRIRIYDPGLFDQADPIWDKVFDWSHVGETINGPRKINNIKKLVATANNRKKYAPAPGNNLYKLKEGFKLTDLIDISGIKGLEYINIENNHVTIMFAKDLDILRRYAVLTQTLCGFKKPIGLDHIINSLDIPQTADGWYCIIFKNY